MRKLTFAQIVLVVAVATGMHFKYNEVPPVYFGDVIALMLLALIVWWGLRGRGGDSPGAEHARKSLALRLGQSFGRLLSRAHL